MADALGFAVAIALAAAALRRVPVEVGRWRVRRRNLMHTGTAPRGLLAPLPGRRGRGADAPTVGGAPSGGRLHRRLTRGLYEAAVPCDESRAVAFWGLATVLGATGGALVASLPGAAAGAVTGLVAPPVALWAARGRRERLVVDSLPDFLERVARSLRAGVSTAAAMEEAAPASGPLAADLGGVLADVRGDRPLAAALDRWCRRSPMPEIALASAALSIGAAAGGRRAPAVDGVAATLRENRNSQREVASLAQQGRLSGLLIALLPVGFLALSVMIDAESVAGLYSTPLGVVCAVAGLSLNMVAFAWMRRITRLR
jgi:tight adherence protein B